VLEVQTRVLDLLAAAGPDLGYEVIRKPVTPPWLQRPGVRECRDHWQVLCDTYTELTGQALPAEMPPRERRQLDGVIVYDDGTRRVVEVDEEQHFTPMRGLTLRRYNGRAVAFDVAAWTRRCEVGRRLRGGGFGKPKPPPFPDAGGRHQQRAFRDMLADLLPPMYGWKPTLRIADDEVTGWLHARDADERLARLVDEKIRCGDGA
jgi:hypothetical protein